VNDDLVKRLRQVGEGAYIGAVSKDRKAAREAADRIEQLEAAIDDILQYVSRADWHYLKEETRKALEGKE